MTKAEIKVLKLARSDDDRAKVLIAQATIKVLGVICDHKWSGGQCAYAYHNQESEICVICGITRSSRS